MRMPAADENTYFNNFLQTGYEELGSWTPPYYQSIKEADANLRFAGSTVDQIAGSLEKFCRNMFAKTMDEETLARMEEFFYMPQNATLDIDERRRLLGIAMSGTGKMSTEKIADIIRTYTGAESSFVFMHNLMIYIHITEDDRLGSVDTLKKELGAKMPAHIHYITNYRTELSIDDRDIEHIEMDRLSLKMAVPFWYRQILNGKWILDGTKNLDGEFWYGMNPSLTSKFAIKNHEGISMRSAVNALVYDSFSISPSVFIYGKVAEQHDLFCTSALMRSDLHMNSVEQIEISIERRSVDCKFLDGGFLLDGTHILNSVHEKEEDL